MSECVVPLTSTPTSAAFDQIELYRRRFGELWANWESLRQSGIRLGGSFKNLGSGAVSGGGCGVESHRLKGFYLDFRVFWAQEEPTNYFKVASLLGRHCTDSRFHTCLKVNKERWHNAGVLHEWHGFTAEELTNVMFNAQLFHTASDLRATLNRLEQAMSSDLAHHLLTFCIYDRMLVIRNLNWMIEPLGTRSQIVRIPADYA